MRVGGDLRSQEDLLWLEKIKCFHTNGNDPGEDSGERQMAGAGF